MFGCKLVSVDLDKTSGVLYNMMTSDNQYLYSTKINFIDIEDFRSWLRNRLEYDFHDFYLIVNASQTIVYGYVHNYDFSLINENCKLVVNIFPEFQDLAIGSIAAFEFIDKLFRQYPLKKVYSTVYSYNRKSIENNIAAGLTEEGVISDFRYHNGKYHGLHIFSITREKFDSVVKGVMN